MTKEKVKLWLAVSMVACIIWAPMLPSFLHKISKPVSSQAEDGIGNHSANWISIPSLTDWLVVVVGAGQSMVIGGQRSLMNGHLKVTEKQLRLARDEFLASHRPEFAVHFIRLLPFRVGLPPDDQPIRSEFAVSNKGTSAGTILKSAVYLEYLPTGEHRDLRRLSANDGIIPIKYEAGMADKRVVEGDFFSGLVHDHAMVDECPAKTLYFRGWLLYEDGLGFKRTTFFCRQYNQKTETFSPVNDPDCNATY